MRGTLTITCIMSYLALSALNVTAGSFEGSLPIDIGECELRVVKTEIIQEAQVSGKTLEAEDSDHRLIAMTIEATSSETGIVIINAYVFSAFYMIPDHTQLILAKAVGRQEENSRGELEQIWTSYNRNGLGFVAHSGEKFGFQLIFEIPEDIDSIAVCVPTILDSLVDVGL